MKKYFNFIPIIILAAGGILRAASYGTAAIWYDEAITLYRSGLPFMQTWTNLTDNSGCLLLELLLRPLLAISHSLWLLRLPSLLAGLASLYLVWLIMREMQFSLPQQIMASAFVAFLPGLLWMGQDARVYGLLAMIFLLALYFALQGRLLGLTACLGLIIYCHDISPAYAFAAWLIAVYLRPWKIRRLLISGVIACLSWVPAIARIYLVSFSKFTIMQPWQPHLTLNWFTNQSLMAVFASGNEILKFGAFIVSLATIGLLFTRAWKCCPRNTLLIGIFIPPLVMSIVSFAWNNIIVYRALMPGLFILALWFGWEFGSRLTSVSAYRLSMAFGWTLLLAFGLSLWHPSDRGGRLDQVAGSIRSQWRTGDLLVYETQTTALPFQYYLSDLPHYYWMNISNILLNEPGVPRINTGDMTNARRIWLVTVEDILIKPAERDQVRAAFPTRALQWKIHYIQASTIDVYLIEN